jgi:hypothetical protein
VKTVIWRVVKFFCRNNPLPFSGKDFASNLLKQERQRTLAKQGFTARFLLAELAVYKRNPK